MQIINKIKEMDFPPGQASIESSNRKLERIRKNILHDVLVYNLQASNAKRRQKKIQIERDQLMFDQMVRKEREMQNRENQQKRLNIIEKRKRLQREYDREIEEKRMREERQKKQDEMYARIEKEHQIYSNQRRIYDLQRIYNRKAYHAKLVDRDQRSNRIRTQPMGENPERDNDGVYSARKHNREYSQNQLKNQRQFHQNRVGYTDSLDQLQSPQNKNYPNKRYSGVIHHQDTPKSPYADPSLKRVSFA